MKTILSLLSAVVVLAIFSSCGKQPDTFVSSSSKTTEITGSTNATTQSTLAEASTTTSETASEDSDSKTPENTTKGSTAATESNAGKIVKGIFTSTDNTFQIKVPSGWTVLNASGIPMIQAPDGSGNNMNIVTTPADRNMKTYGWSDYETVFIQLWGKKPEMHEFEHITIDGCDSTFLSYSIELMGSNNTFYQYVIGAPENCYTVTFTVMSPKHGLVDTIEACALSFKRL